jgi:hypothetical protein
MPFCILGAETVRKRRWTDLCLLALVLGCFLTVYPLFVPILAVASAAVLAWLAWRRRRGEPLLDQLRPVAGRILVLVVLAILFDLVALTRDVSYYGKIIDNTVPLPRVGYHLPLEVLPGWLTQTREFWLLTSLGSGGLKQLVLGALIPAAFLAFIVVGLKRHRIGLALVALAGLCALTAEYSYASREACTYCGERDLLPLAPVIVVLLALGLSTLLAMPARWARALGVIGAVLVLVAVGQRARIELKRFSEGSYFLDSANRNVLSHLPSSANAVQLEGFGETTSAQAEQPLVYQLANEHLRGRVSIALGSDLYNGIEYLDFGPIKSPGPEFHPEYEYVLTRLAGIDTGRTVIARSRGIALERRTQPLDVITYAGTAWVQPEMPLQMYVSGRKPGRVWVRLTFVGQEPIALPPQKGVRSQTHGDTLVVCVPTSGSPPIRSATVRITAGDMPGTVPAEEFPPSVPQEGVALASMHAITGRCTLGAVSR